MNSNYKVGVTWEEINSEDCRLFLSSPDAGANVLFFGTTRATSNPNGCCQFNEMNANKPNNHSHNDSEKLPVTHLSYSCHERLAVKSMTTIAQQALQKPGVIKVLILHKLGEVPVGEISVVVGVSCAHRREGWEVADWVLEEVKRKVEIWKKEVFENNQHVWKSNAKDDLLNLQ